MKRFKVNGSIVRKKRAITELSFQLRVDGTWELIFNDGTAYYWADPISREVKEVSEAEYKRLIKLEAFI